MSELITANLSTRPDIFTYQGKFFRKIVEDYDNIDFSIVIDETFGIYGTPGFDLPVLLSPDNISKLDNMSARDLTSIYVQSPENTTNTQIAIIDPFTDATIINVTTREDNEGNLITALDDTTLDIPGSVYSLRLKGTLYNITYYGTDYQTDIVGSSAFRITPVTESLLKTGDYNLITTISGDDYIDIISNTTPS